MPKLSDEQVLELDTLITAFFSHMGWDKYDRHNLGVRNLQAFLNWAATGAPSIQPDWKRLKANQ